VAAINRGSQGLAERSRSGELHAGQPFEGLSRDPLQKVGALVDAGELHILVTQQEVSGVLGPHGNIETFDIDVAGQALGPAVDRGHVRMWAFDPDEQSLFDRLGVSRRLEPNADGDDVMVTISNANPNKADTYLHRTITYDATVDDATDQVRATVAVDLQNGAPTELSDYVVGNANGEPRGSNRTFLSLYTGLDVDGATLDGAPLPVELHEEYGLKRAAAFVTVPPGGRVRVVFDLGGSVVMDERYHLRLHTPTLVQPDRVEVRLRADEGQVGRPELASETVEGEPALGPGSAAFALVGQADLWFPLRT
jgi:hypothetical protein